MFYEELFEKLNMSGVDYVVVGGVALVLHGVVRLTADLDLMVHLEEGNLSKFVDIMNELGYRPKVPVKSEEFINAKTRATWINEKNMKVFSFFHPERPVKYLRQSRRLEKCEPLKAVVNREPPQRWQCYSNIFS